jgi:hypothetical protein
MKFALLIYIVADDFFYITLFLYLYLYLGPIWSVAKGMFGVGGGGGAADRTRRKEGCDGLDATPNTP